MVPGEELWWPELHGEISGIFLTCRLLTENEGTGHLLICPRNENILLKCSGSKILSSWLHQVQCSDKFWLNKGQWCEPGTLTLKTPAPEAGEICQAQLCSLSVSLAQVLCQNPWVWAAGTWEFAHPPSEQVPWENRLEKLPSFCSKDALNFLK